MSLNVILDTGVITLIIRKKRSKEIKQLCQDLINGTRKGFIIKPILTEIAKHLTKKYGKQVVFSEILSFIEIYKIGFYSTLSEDFIQAGILQYQTQPVLSACDSIIVILAAKERWSVYTTDKEMIDHTPPNFKNRISFKKYTF